jgi:amino acid transporter
MSSGPTPTPSEQAPPADISSGTEVPIQEGKKFGTFGGVFTPTLLTVLGAILFLRTGWIVGNAGLLGAVLIILLASVITITTGLSIASIATNIRVRAGGAFSIISQSLGLEVGGSVSVPFYFAQSIAVAFYVFAFTEGWLKIFPDHPEVVVVFACFTLAFVLAFLSASLAVRTQYLILTILLFALLSIFLGSFSIGDAEGMTQQAEDWGSFEEGDFWLLFSIFFPAVTGVLAGVNMSGDLANPRRSIPVGTLSAIVLSSLVYLAVAYWFSRVATPQALIENQLIAVDRAAFGPAVLAGILAATFSSALTSLVGAPRLLQAIAEHDIVPGGGGLAHLNNGEPRRAMVVTGVIGLGAIIFGLTAGGLDAIAPLMTMFFLVTYAVLNGVVLFEMALGLVSFRPRFRIPWFVPLVGLLGCLFAMFLIAPVFSLVAIAVALVLYGYLTRRHLQAPWSDVRSGLLVRIAQWTARRVSDLPTDQERAWKPDLLVPVRSTEHLLGSYRFLQSIAVPRGSVRVIGIHPPGERQRFEGINHTIRRLNESRVFARVALVETEDYMQGLLIGLDVLHSIFFSPNGLFTLVGEETEQAFLQDLMERAQANEIGCLYLLQHPVTTLGREKVINVWLSSQAPDWEIALRLSNIDLSFLLAYQLARNWDGHLRLLMTVQDADQKPQATAFMEQLVDLGRMPRDTEIVVAESRFPDYVQEAPHADINIFGMGEQVNLELMRQLVEYSRSSCLFVRSSGKESALA